LIRGDLVCHGRKIPSVTCKGCSQKALQSPYTEVFMCNWISHQVKQMFVSSSGNKIIFEFGLGEGIRLLFN